MDVEDGGGDPAGFLRALRRARASVMVGWIPRGMNSKTQISTMP